MKDNKSASLFQKEQVIDSIKQSFVKLNPRVMIKNPIMFTVEVCTAIMFLVMLYSIVNDSQDSFIYNLCIIRKSKFPQNPKRSVRFSGKRTKRSVQKRKARNTQKAETKVL